MVNVKAGAVEESAVLPVMLQLMLKHLYVVNESDLLERETLDSKLYS